MNDPATQTTLATLLPRLATATPQQLDKIAVLLDGKDSEPFNARTFGGREAAKMMRISPNVLYHKMNTGQIAYIESPGSSRRVPETAILDYFNANMKRGPAPANTRSEAKRRAGLAGSAKRWGKNQPDHKETQP